VDPTDATVVDDHDIMTVYAALRNGRDGSGER
jgi:hypothetical protein